MSESKAIAACAQYVRVNVEIRRLSRDIGDALAGCPANPMDDTARPHLFEYYANVNMGEAAFLDCPHCIEADRLVQLRKAARKSLGAAKRQITKIGRAA